MSAPTQQELHGEAFDLCGTEWDKMNNRERFEWALKTDLPGLGFRLMAHLDWNNLPVKNKESLYRTYLESK